MSISHITKTLIFLPAVFLFIVFLTVFVCLHLMASLLHW